MIIIFITNNYSDIVCGGNILIQIILKVTIFIYDI